MSTPTRHGAGRKPRTGVRIAGVAGAVSAAVAVWAVATLALGVELQVTFDTEEVQDVGVGSVVVASLAAALAGWGLLALLERFTKRGRSTWTVIAAVALVASMAPTLAGVDGGATATLAALHVTVAAVLIGVLPRA